MQIIAEGKRVQLPERESQVLSLAAQGYTDKQIALDLGISQETVGTYWRRILLRFGAASRTEVVAKLAESAASSRINAAEAQAEALQKEVSVHASAHAEEAAKRAMAEAIKEASLNFIGGVSSFGATFKQVLEAIISITESEYGFIAETNYDESGRPYLRTRAITDIAWNEETRILFKQKQEEGFEFRNLDTLYGRALKTESAYISNDAKNDRYAAGLPAGHPPLNAFLGLPVFLGQAMIGMIGIANRVGGYDAEMVEHLSPMTNACARLISAYRADVAWKEAEKEIVASGHRLTLLMDTLTSGVLFGDREGKVEFVNTAFCRMFGLPCTPFELIGSDCTASAESMAGLFADSAGFAGRVKEIISAGEPVTSEVLELRDGRVFARDFLPVQVCNEVRGYLWHFRDITSRARQTNTLVAILDAVSDAVIVVDDAGVVKIWNKKAEELFGFARVDAVGHDLAEMIIPKALIKQYRAGLRALMLASETDAKSLKVEVANRDGKAIPVELSVMAIRSEGHRQFAALFGPSSPLGMFPEGIKTGFSICGSEGPPRPSFHRKCRRR